MTPDNPIQWTYGGFYPGQFNDPVAWLEHGIDRGWVSDGFCDRHDGYPDGFSWLYEDGMEDACVPTVLVLFLMPEFPPEPEREDGVRREG